MYLVVYNQSIVLTDDYKKPGVELFKTEAKINATRYDQTSNSFFAALSDGKIMYWSNLKSDQDKPVQFASIPEAAWGDISINPKKKILAAGFGNTKGAVYLWNITTKQQIQVLRGHTARITGIVFSPNGDLMATASYDNSVRLWHLNDLNTLPIVIDDSEKAWITSVIFSNDNQYILTGDNKGKIRKYPVNAKFLIDDYCKYLTRTLNEEEWKNYVGEDIEYKPNKCN